MQSDKSIFLPWIAKVSSPQPNHNSMLLTPYELILQNNLLQDYIFLIQNNFMHLQ